MKATSDKIPERCADGLTYVRLPLQVVFPLVLDLYEFCTEDYKKALEGPRKAWQEAEDKRAGLEKAAKAAAKSAAKDDRAQVAPIALARTRLLSMPVHSVLQKCCSHRDHPLTQPCPKTQGPCKSQPLLGCPILNAPMCRQMVLTRLGRQQVRVMPTAAKLTWR